MNIADYIAANSKPADPPASPPPASAPTGEHAKLAGWDRPTIDFQESALVSIIDQLTSLVPAANESKLFPLIMQRDGSLVRLPVDPVNNDPLKAHDVTTAYLRYYFSKIACFITPDRRKRGDGMKEICCPKLIGETFLAKSGEYGPIPVLKGIIPHITMLPDGRILDKPGYDRTTGLFLDIRGREFPPVREAPSVDDAQAALQMILDLFSEFPFKSPTDRSVAVSFFLTTLVRWSLPIAPGFGVSASTRGTGKTWLVSTVSLAVMGREPVLVNYTSDEKEMSQRLFSILKMASGGVICLDNIEQPLRGESLNSAITSPQLTCRELGVSQMQDVDTAITLACTGNNLLIQGDLTTRFILTELDAGLERPEDRRFSRDVKRFALEAGPSLVSAGLTLLKAYILAKDKKEVSPWRFEAWNVLIRGSLLWLGQPDPLEKLRAAEADDPDRSALAAVLATWYAVFHDRPMSAKSVLDASVENDELKTAFENAVFSKSTINPRSLGRWIMARKERRINGLRFVKAGEARSGAMWRGIYSAGLRVRVTKGGSCPLKSRVRARDGEK